MYIGLLVGEREPSDPAYKRVEIVEGATSLTFPIATTPWGDVTHMGWYDTPTGDAPTTTQAMHLGFVMPGVQVSLDLSGRLERARQERETFEAWLAAQPQMTDEWWLAHIRAAFGERISVSRQVESQGRAWGAYWQHYSGFGDTPLEAISGAMQDQEDEWMSD